MIEKIREATQGKQHKLSKLNFLLSQTENLAELIINFLADNLERHVNATDAYDTKPMEMENEPPITANQVVTATTDLKTVLAQIEVLFNNSLSGLKYH